MEVLIGLGIRSRRTDRARGLGGGSDIVCSLLLIAEGPGLTPKSRD